jgi:hypothetical protein
MSPQEIVIEATLKPDGTLELDEKPSLPPGRVTVVLRQTLEPTPQREDWWQFLQRARSELVAAGAPFMSDEEMKAHLEWLRQPDPIDDLLRRAGEEHQRREPS